MLPTKLLAVGETLTVDTSTAVKAYSRTSSLPQSYKSVLNGSESGEHDGIRISARAYVIYSDGVNQYVVYSDNNDAPKSIANGSVSKSVNGVRRALAQLLLDAETAGAVTGLNKTALGSFSTLANVAIENVWSFIGINKEKLLSLS